MTGAERVTTASIVFLGATAFALGALHFIQWVDFQARPKLHKGAK